MPWWMTEMGIDGLGVLAVENTCKGTADCKIQDAIDDAVDGNTIEVAPGIYTENIIVSKGVTLKGANAGLACGSRGSETILAPGIWCSC